MAGMGNGPMGGGIATDIVTRKPEVPRTPEDRAAAAKAQMDGAVMRAVSLQADLAQSPVLELLLRQFTNRVSQLTKTDPVCQTLLGVLVNIRSTIDIVPEYAHRRFQEILGATVQVPPPVAPDPAAEAIPETEQA
jgi:hypothetical protein